MLPYVILALKGAAVGVGAWAGNKAIKKGEALIEEAGGLGGASDAAQGLLSRLDIFDVFGTKERAHQEELDAQEAERKRDKNEAKKREKAIKKDQKQQLDALKRSQKQQLDALKAGTGADVARLTQQLQELEARHRRELEAATTRTDRELAKTRLANVRMMRNAQQQAQQPSATQQLRELVELAAQLVHKDGVAPEANMFVQQGMPLPDMSDLDAILEGAEPPAPVASWSW